jgi:hypothetical protein
MRRVTTGRSRLWAATLWGATLWGATSSGCQSKDVTDCRTKYLGAHALVSEVDTNDLESVKPALQAVTESLVICERAQLAEETEQLKSAQRKLESAEGYLLQRQSKRETTPEELVKFAVSGDPRCPRGQHYLPKATAANAAPQKIRCVGPQVLQMNRTEAREYFAGRGFKITESGAALAAEFGAESYRYTYESAQESKPAQCVVIYSQPGIAWQETVARVSGVAPRRLKEGQPITLGDRQIEFKVTGDENQAVLTFGECSTSK